MFTDLVGREGSKLKKTEANTERKDKDANDTLEDGRGSPKDRDKPITEGDELVCVDRWSDFSNHVDVDKAENKADYSEMPERGRGRVYGLFNSN